MTEMVRPSISYVATSEQLHAVVDAYRDVEEFVLDVETVGDHRIDPRRNRVLWIGLAATGRADVIPMGHPNGELIEIKRGLHSSGVERLKEGKKLRKADVSTADSRVRKVFSEPPVQLEPAEVFSALRPVLYGAGRKVGANVKFDLESVAKYYGGELPPPPYGDVIVADFLSDDTHQHQMGLAHICRRRLGHVVPKGVGAEVEVHSFQDVAQYLMGDIRYTWLLWKQIKPELEDARLSKVLDLEMDLIAVLMEMEQRGVRIDTEAMETLRDELARGIIHVTADAYTAAGEQFNINSVAEKRRLLFTPEGQNLTPKVFTDKTKLPSTSEEALAAHPRNKLCAALLELAQIKKLQSTYVIPYLGGEIERTSAGKTRTEVRESNLVKGRIHTNYKQHGARTGRLSSTNPNLQNIPSRGAFGPRIRSMFMADPGYKMIVADYAQIEPRVIASLTGDPVMTQAFLDGRDIYTAIAEPLGLDRKAGKLLVLAMAYGVGPDKLAVDLSMTITAARDILDEFEHTYPVIADYKAALISSAQRHRPPFIRTITGRRRYIPFLRSSDFGLREQGKRQVFNTKIQGSSADIMKIAMIYTHHNVPPGVQLLLNVHDEIVAQAPDDLAEEAAAVIKESMESVRFSKITVPLIAEVGIGNNWAEAK